MQLAFDTSKIAIFDADTGQNLTLPASGSNGQPAQTSEPAPPPSEPAPPPSEPAPPPPAE